jgi:hemoglobin
MENLMSEASLYERLGAGDKIREIVADIWENHISNPIIKNRYAGSDPDHVKQVVWEFFCAGTGGPQAYSGDDMLKAHTGMNISDEEFNAVTDDVLKALDKNNVGKQERDEVLVILYSMKGEIAHV